MSQDKMKAPALAGHKYRTAPSPSAKIPKGIPYIIGNEAAERFSFYGMKGILVVFMTSYLFMMPGATGEAMAEPKAIENYHLFTTAVYFTPILGALLADILLGKYLTIISLSIVYCLGHGVLAFMGMNDGINPGLMLFLGLGLISIGSGGIKPCVSAHVGDQFGDSNGHLLSKVFGWFYFSINTGAFLSTLMTPWFLEWYGPHLAFGVPGVLMVLATILFWMGRHSFIHVPPGGLKWFKETFSWRGISAILKLSVIYVFVAVFWALFDQTGSSWVLQAQDLDRNWLGVESDHDFDLDSAVLVRHLSRCEPRVHPDANSEDFNRSIYHGRWIRHGGLAARVHRSGASPEHWLANRRVRNSDSI